MSKKRLKYDESSGKIHSVGDKKKKPKHVTIVKKQLEEEVKKTNESNDIVIEIFNTFPDFTIISENASLVDLLKRITFSPSEFQLFDTPYLFILPQLTEWGSSASKRTDLVGKFQYPENINDVFSYNNKEYKLIGVVYHSGYAGGGHYVAEVLREGKLYLCNDSS